MSQTPLLIFSDAVSAPSGLARITRDLASRIHANLPEFRVATIGYGGSGSSRFPWTQYSWTFNREWIIYDLDQIWEDFAQGEQGIFLSIYDASRMLWFARPEMCTDARIRKFLESKPFEKWGYFPIDATGPNDRLTTLLRHCIEGYDRVLAYSKWAEDILRRTLNKKTLLDGLTNLPHGIDTSVFYHRPRVQARHGFGQRIQCLDRHGRWLTVPDDVLCIGIVATNQPRKDFGLGIAAVAEIAKKRRVMVWVHTDEIDKHWNLPGLFNDFGVLREAVVTTLPLTDEQMAWCYSACDVTLGIGCFEGFGYPIFESLACGTACIHGNGGGAAEHMPTYMLVEPKCYRYEGLFCCSRPVFEPEQFSARSLFAKDCTTKLPLHLDWNNLWPRWEQWLKKGLDALHTDNADASARVAAKNLPVG